ncbi:MAG: RNA polymerase sigma-70 factor [Longimicrobiales bacterium]
MQLPVSQEEHHAVHPRHCIPYRKDSRRLNDSRGESNAHQNGRTPEHPVPVEEILAFERLFRTYHARLCAFARRYVQCPDVADEVVEEVFLRIRELRRNWPDSGNEKCYLYTAVRNQALMHLAHECVVRQSHAIVNQKFRIPGMGQSPAAPDEEFQAKELAAVLQFAIDRLPERCREAYTLYRERGMSYAEIADVMGISARTVETQLARANKVLRRQLDQWLC